MSHISEGTVVAGRFVVAERIGEGGMGAVYRALQTSLDRQVALKVLHSQAAFTPRARRRFGREARAVARLNHPHIASVYDFGTDNDDQTLWLAMELVDGRSLTPLKREPIDVLRIIGLTDQILSALSAAHARGIIHRDLKPSNVLLTRDDSGREIIKLVDFGLAATQEGDLDLDNAPGGLGEEPSDAGQSRVIMGTPRYMAPELFRRQPVDPRVDLYALGIILFEILAGQPPYPGDDPRQIMRGHLREPIPQLRPREGEIPAELERCIYRLLAKDPVERYQTAAEVREELGAIIAQFSYVPWMVTGPRLDGEWGSMSQMGNLSAAGFLSGYGGRTVPPSVAMNGLSRPGTTPAAQAPLVGREGERRTMERHIRNAIGQGQGSIVVVEGEGGVGKTRLVQWLRVRVEEAGVMRVANGAFTRTAGGFQGIRAILEEVLGTRDMAYEDMPYAVDAKLRKWDFGPDESDLIVRLMQPGGESAVFEGTGPASERRLSAQERAFAAIERILRIACAAKPWLLVLEDLHHAGETTLSFLQHLAVGMHLDPMPLTLIATVRSEELSQVPELRFAFERLARFGSENFARVRLERLSTEDAARLVLKLAPLDERLARRIAHRSAGNPLHVTQILRYLQESGKLAYHNGQWQLAAGTNVESEIPTELGDLMRHRVHQMVSRHADASAIVGVLERAAILGQRFDYRLLRHFIGVEPGRPYREALDGVLEILVREGFLREVGHSGEDVLEFDHVLLRDVLLADMEGRRSLMVLHKLAAETKTAFFGKRSGQIALQIVDHYRRAREPGGVYAFTVKAARAALETSDLRTAAGLYRDAKELVDNGHITMELGELDDFSGVLDRDEVALELAHLERRLGEYGSAREHYRRLLGDGNQLVALWSKWGLGEVARRQGALEEAVGWFEVGLREAEGAAATFAAKAGADDRSADDRSGDERSGDERAAASTAPEPGAVDGSPVAASRLVAAFCLYGLGAVAHSRGELVAAEEHLSEALGRTQRLQHRVLEAEVLRRLTDVVWRRGDANRAEVFYRRASILEESFGDRETLAQGRLSSAAFLREVGQIGRAEAHAEQARATFEELGKRHLEARCLLALGHIAWCRGSYKLAANHLRQAHRHFEAFEDRRGITQCNLHLARLAMSVQRLKETQALLQQAHEGFRAMGDRHGLAQVRVLYARLEHAVGRFAQARESFEHAARVFEELDDRRLAASTRAFELLCLEELGSHAEVDAGLSPLIEELGALALADEALATAFDKLCALINSRRPELAMQLDAIAEETWQRLGRTARQVSV